jgi:hypothetical protein
LQGRGERRSPDHGRLQDAPTIEAIGPVGFYDFIWFDGFAKNPSFPQGESLRRLPEIDPGIGVALPAEDQGQPVAAPGAPDVEDPAILAERLSAAVADHNGFVFVATLAGSSFRDRNHENFPLIIADGWALLTSKDMIYDLNHV